MADEAGADRQMMTAAGADVSAGIRTEPLDAMASLLWLHCEAGWSASWQLAFGLADADGRAHGSPGALAAALLAMLDAADAGEGAAFGTENPEPPASTYAAAALYGGLPEARKRFASTCRGTYCRLRAHSAATSG